MNSRALRFVLPAIFAALLSLSPVAIAAPPAQILAAPKGPVNDHVPAFVRSTASAKAVRFNSDAMLNLSPGTEVELTLPNAKKNAYVFELQLAHGNGIYSWIGRHKTRGNHDRIIVTTGPSGSFGVLYTPDGEYRLVPGDGHDWLIDMTAEAPAPLNLGHDELVPPPRSKSSRDVTYAPTTMARVPGVNSLAVTASTPTPQVIVDLMIVYTNGIAAKLGTGLMTRLYNIVTMANTAYADSEVAITLRLVGTMSVNYSDATSDSAALAAISPGEGSFNASIFGGVEAARTANGADLVAFFRDGPDFGGTGLAWIGSTTPDPLYMYSVTTGCVQGCESVMIHEMGHNMGNVHDRATASWQAGGTATPPAGAFSYSYGYAYCDDGLGNPGPLSCNPTLPNGSGGACAANSQPECASFQLNNFSDIMAYFQGTTEKILKFSNPNVDCMASFGDVPRPCGVVDTDPASANTALSMNNNRVAISSVKSAVATQPQPGSLQFTASAVAASETTGTMNFIVSRLGGSNGAVGATYSTSGGTAVPGTHYTASSGTVSWGNGDTANKTISIPLLANGPDAIAKTFNLALFSPTGPAGVSLGFPNVATGIIMDDTFPAGGIFPPAFVTGGSAWTVRSDRVYEGGFSLGSAQVYGSIGPPDVYANSDVSYTGTFVDGQLGFAYNVSSWGNNPGYPDYGHLEFSIDGNVVLSIGGETGWRYFTHPITAAGSPHTLLWRFTNAMPSFQPCSSPLWNPPAPGGASCADRAWIDAVVLPLSSPSPPSLVSVVSHKAHTGLGNGDLTVNTAAPIGGAITVEPRNGTAVLVFTFDQAVTSTGTISSVDASSNPVGFPTGSVSGSTVTVTLTGVPNNQRVTVTVPNVNGTLASGSASVGVLAGDVNGSRSVTASDILITKGKASAAIASNFAYDVDLSGVIDSADVDAVKANAGLSIP